AAGGLRRRRRRLERPGLAAAARRRPGLRGLEPPAPDRGPAGPPGAGDLLRGRAPSRRREGAGRGRHFKIDAKQLPGGGLQELALAGGLDREKVAEAIKRYDLDPG